MLTDEDIELLKAMIANLLETYGLKKPPSAAALRQLRYRERLKLSVTGHNESVTPSPEKRNGASRKRNGVHHPIAEPDESAIVITIPLNDGTEYGVTERMVKEFEQLYAGVDVPQTLREIKGWNLTKPTRRKTRSGILGHINGWLAKEQNK